MSKPRILLTGASGAVGYEALKQLMQDGRFEVRLLSSNSRRARKRLQPFRDQVEILTGDITVPADVEQACKNVDAAIHLAAIIPPLADEQPEWARRVNARGTENLVQGLERHSPGAQMLYSSSISVYGDRLQDPWIKVGDELKVSEGDKYAETKISAEKIIQESDLDWSIFRLTAIMGVNNHKPGGLMFHMPLESCMEICTPEDTARAFVKALDKRHEVSKRIFNLSGGEECRVTYREFLEENFRIFGLGGVNFPEKCFAEKNFHCGYYSDGDDLNDILDFRKETLADYYTKLRKSVPGAQKVATGVVKGLVKYYLVKQSEPLKAHRQGDRELQERFFQA